MATKADVEGFLAQKTLAVAGVSRSGKKFGNMAYRKLKSLGYRVIPVHPEAEQIEGDPCFPSLNALPEPVGGLLISLPAGATEKIVREAGEAGIRHIWIQQGAGSKAAVSFCREQDMAVVDGECILMFAQPSGIHRFHRWVWKLFGKLPD